MGTGTIVCPSSLLWLGIRPMLSPCFNQMCLFQALLPHCFVCLLKNVATTLQREKLFSMEIVRINSRRSLSSSYWEGKELINMSIALCGRDVPEVKSNVLLSSQMFSASYYLFRRYQFGIYRCVG